MSKDINKIVNTDSNLDYKKHDWYFEELDILLKDFIAKYNLCLIGKNKPDSAYIALNAIIMWSSDQFEAIGVIEDLLKDLTEIKVKVKKNTDGVLKDIFDLFLKINKYLSKTENKPKVRITMEDEYDKFWRVEENAGLREMKKAFFDSFMLPED